MFGYFSSVAFTLFPPALGMLIIIIFAELMYNLLALKKLGACI